MRKIIFKILPFLFSATILAAAAAAVFFARGLRFDFQKKEVFPTGILKIETAPKNAAIFIDKDFAGFSPYFSRGEKLAEIAIKIQKGGFQNWHKKVEIDATKITNFAPKLLPKNFEKKIRVVRENYFFDKFERGVLILRPNLKAIEVFDFVKKRHFLKFLKFIPQKISFAENGDAFVHFAHKNQKFAFFKKVTKLPDAFFAPEKNRFSPTKDFLLLFGGKSVFRFSNDANELFLTRKFENEIEAIFWLQNSSSIFTATKNAIFLLDFDGENLQKIATKNADSLVFFESQKRWLFWENDRGLNFWEF